MIALYDQAYYVPGIPKDLCTISPKGILTPEGYKGTFIARCNDYNHIYVEINLKEEKPGWQKAEPMERVYIKYDPRGKLPNHEAILLNHREK